MAARTLVVDLDGTLIRSDLLVESFWAVASRRGGLVALGACRALLQGRAALKARLAEIGPVDVAGLPYNTAVLDYIRARRAAGARVALVTASVQPLAEAVAAHLGLFDEVHGTKDDENLKGARKAAFCVDRFGRGGFDYIGDAEADLPVWAAAATAIVVAPGAALMRRLAVLDRPLETLPAARPAPRDLIRALRPHQWLKNLLVFLPALAAHNVHLPVLAAGLLAFAAFSLVASAVYVLNDLLDLRADRAHPRKRNRPFASGAVPLLTGTLMAPALLLAGLVLALPLGARFLGVLLLYFVTTTAYSLHFKRRMVADIVLLAALYTLRIMAGGVATHIHLTVWLLAFSMFFFFSLAAVKRQAELVDGVASGRSAAGRGYLPQDLPLVEMMAMGSGYVSVLVMALYLASPEITNAYPMPDALWGICVILLYWISRVVLVAHRGQMHDDPVVYAVRDRVSLMCGAAILACAVAGAVL